MEFRNYTDKKQTHPSHSSLHKNTPITYQDRFIPNRTATSNQLSMFLLNKQKNQTQDYQSTYGKMIAEGILSHSSDSQNKRIINYKKPIHNINNKILKLNKQNSNSSSLVSNAPVKILDAPQIKDDYYLNLLDWSSSGMLSILLGSTAYLYTPGRIWTLDQLQSSYLCSVSFSPRGGIISIGTSKGSVRFYDVQKVKLIREIEAHQSRVSSLQWASGMLYSGGKDSRICCHDVRSDRSLQFKLQGHRGQICGMKQDGNNGTQLATGGNDNMLLIWDLNMRSCRHVLTGHKAAVKALAWCPWKRNLLASGGGTNDKTMKFWNIQNGQLLNQVNTQSQVCSLIWNRYDKQIVSSHGFSKNQITIWKYPQLTKNIELQGHQNRVLHMAMSPDGSTVCSASADQTLRFWKLFDVPEQGEQQKKSCNSLSGFWLR